LKSENEEIVLDAIKKIFGSLHFNKNNSNDRNKFTSQDLQILNQLLHLLSSNNIQIQLESIKSLKSIAVKEEINYILRQIGAIHKLQPLLTDINTNVLNESALAFSNLLKSSPNSFQDFGFGFHKETGIFDLVVKIKQDHYDNQGIGMAWRIWDSAIWLSQWIFDNKDLIANKKILEVGAGCGLSGIVAGIYSNQVVISDYTPEIVKMLKYNIDLNSKLFRAKPTVIQLDWTSKDLIQNPLWIKKGVDCILGADVYFNPELSVALVEVINKYLSSNGVFLWDVWCTQRGGSTIC